MTAVAVPVPLAGDATRQSKGEIPRESVADAGARGSSEAAREAPVCGSTSPFPITLDL